MKVQDGNFAEAEITAVEVHPKLPGMYRVAVRTSSRPQMEEAEENRESETGWHDEVDALIESASDRLRWCRCGC
jgi:hypothetical protein